MNIYLVINIVKNIESNLYQKKNSTRQSFV